MDLYFYNHNLKIILDSKWQILISNFGDQILPSDPEPFFKFLSYYNTKFELLLWGNTSFHLFQHYPVLVFSTLWINVSKGEGTLCT
jgi:hypothetical protein